MCLRMQNNETYMHYVGCMHALYLIEGLTLAVSKDMVRPVLTIGRTLLGRPIGPIAYTHTFMNSSLKLRGGCAHSLITHMHHRNCTTPMQPTSTR